MCVFIYVCLEEREGKQKRESVYDYMCVLGREREIERERMREREGEGEKEQKSLNKKGKATNKQTSHINNGAESGRERELGKNSEKKGGTRERETGTERKKDRDRQRESQLKL